MDFFDWLYECDMFSFSIGILLVWEGDEKHSLRSDMLYRVACSTGWEPVTWEARELDSIPEIHEAFEKEYGQVEIPYLVIRVSELGIKRVLDYDQAMEWLLKCSHDHMNLDGVDLVPSFYEEKRLIEIENLHYAIMGIEHDISKTYNYEDYGDEDQNALMAMIEDYVEDDWNPQISNDIKEWEKIKNEILNTCKEHSPAEIDARLLEKITIFDDSFNRLIRSFYKPGNNSISERNRDYYEKMMRHYQDQIDLLSGKTGKKSDDVKSTGDEIVDIYKDFKPVDTGKDEFWDCEWPID